VLYKRNYPLEEASRQSFSLFSNASGLSPEVPFHFRNIPYREDHKFPFRLLQRNAAPSFSAVSLVFLPFLPPHQSSSPPRLSFKRTSVLFSSPERLNSSPRPFRFSLLYLLLPRAPSKDQLVTHLSSFVPIIVLVRMGKRPFPLTFSPLRPALCAPPDRSR